jgi:AraC-like DNA-binding protein
MPSQKSRRSGLLRRHAVVRTADPERMRDAMYETFKADSLEVRGDADKFFGQASRIRLRNIGLNYCSYGAEVRLGFPEMPGLRQLICLSGAGETLIDGRRTPLSLDSTCVIPVGSKLDARYGDAFRQIVFSVDPDAVERKLEALLGVSLGKPIEFKVATRFQSPHAHALRRLVLFLVDQIDAPDAELCPATLAEFENATIVAFLCGQEHNFSAMLVAPGAEAGPWQIRMTEEFIAANLDKPLSVTQIAQAVGVSVRAIFSAFQQSRGVSPMMFLKSLRLERAHQMLSRREADQSVMKAAFACGFQSHGHFARSYKLRFGESPSETLARTRGS